jgi:hypothetical protein
MTATTGDLANQPAPRIAVLIRAGDSHAFAIRHALIQRGVPCSIVETDALSGCARMSWSPGGEVQKATIDDVDGNQVEIEDLDLIWLAENKLIQLEAATGEGLRVPRTLVSQDLLDVRRFCRELDHRVVVKTVAGTPKTPIMAGRVTEEMLRSDDAISVSPAIYQELILGRRHLRICCFGERIYGAVLETDRLDWRYPLDAKVEPHEVHGSIVAALRRVLDG